MESRGKPREPNDGGEEVMFQDLIIHDSGSKLTPTFLGSMSESIISARARLLLLQLNYLIYENESINNTLMRKDFTFLVVEKAPHMY